MHPAATDPKAAKRAGSHGKGMVSAWHVRVALQNIGSTWHVRMGTLSWHGLLLRIVNACPALHSARQVVLLLAHGVFQELHARHAFAHSLLFMSCQELQQNVAICASEAAQKMHTFNLSFESCKKHWAIASLWIAISVAT
eukprot:scaffold134498_cov22-Tisochrysis_lutea.AAC.2